MEWKKIRLDKEEEGVKEEKPQHFKNMSGDGTGDFYFADGVRCGGSCGASGMEESVFEGCFYFEKDSVSHFEIAENNHRFFIRPVRKQDGK